MPRGRFVTLEGGEGVGKSTLGASLEKALRDERLEVVLTREPGGTVGAEGVRSLLVSGASDRWSPLSEVLLLAAARRDHVERVIAPALERGAWVICDRYTDSTRAYQGAGGGVAPDALAALDRIVDAPTPDLTLVLDLDRDLAARRLRSRTSESRFERRDEAYHARVRQAFLAIAEKEPQRCVVLDAHQSPETLAAAALAELRRRWPA